jgi:uncharacterized membrane protein
MMFPLGCATFVGVLILLATIMEKLSNYFNEETKQYMILAVILLLLIAFVLTVIAGWYDWIRECIKEFKNENY